jgi:hypothetical protein
MRLCSISCVHILVKCLPILVIGFPCLFNTLLPNVFSSMNSRSQNIFSCSLRVLQSPCRPVHECWFLRLILHRFSELRTHLLQLMPPVNATVNTLSALASAKSSCSSPSSSLSPFSRTRTKSSVAPSVLTLVLPRLTNSSESTLNRAMVVLLLTASSRQTRFSTILTFPSSRPSRLLSRTSSSRTHPSLTTQLCMPPKVSSTLLDTPWTKSWAVTVVSCRVLRLTLRLSKRFVDRSKTVTICPFVS